MKKLVIVLLVMAIGIGSWMFWRQRGTLVSGAAAARIGRDLPLVVAHLENHETGPAITLLEALDRDFPEAKAVRQNLAIARILAAQQGAATATGEATEHTSREEAARRELDRLLKARPDDWHSYALAGLFHEQLGDYETASKQFRAVAAFPLEQTEGRPEREKGDASMLYALWKSAHVTRNDELLKVSREALAAAAQAVPENLWVLVELTIDQIEQQDPALQATCDQWLKLAPVLAESVLRKNRIDLVKSFTEIQSLVKQAQAESDPQAAKALWRKIAALGRPACNVSRSEDAVQTDQKTMERHVLDFVVMDLPEGVTTTTAGTGTSVSPELPLRWTTVPLPEGLDVAAVRSAQYADLTLDRRPELCVLSADQFRVWSRSTEGAWQLVMETPSEDATGFALVDLDDDARFKLANTPANKNAIQRADLDLVLYGPQGIRLVENQLSGEVRQWVPWPAERSAALGAAIETVEPADLDLDGDMDLLVAGPDGLRIGFNTGQPMFFVRSDTPVGVPDGLQITRLVSGDFDRDLDIDALAVAGGQVYRLDGVRHAVLRWQAIPELAQITGVTDLAVQDVDGNVSWDLTLATPGGVRRAMTRTVSAGRWQFDASSIGFSTKPSMTRCIVADFDNDGTEDIAGDGVLWRGSGTDLLQPTGWTLAESGTLAGARPTAADFDQDGDLDLCWSGPGQLALWANEGGNQNAWLDLEVVGVQTGNDAQKVASGRVNHYGAGGLLELRSTSGFQARIVRSENPHFGLGPAGKAELVRLIWPNGFPYNVFQPASNETLWEVQTLLGSCPYLYAWDGDKYVFVTDLLWAAPLGMPSPAGGLTPSRDWEYLKISGTNIRPRDGKYQFQLTEELYEAAYFDQVELVAIDHPADVAIYSNEKVGPPSIAERRVHTVREPRPPVTARDQAGRDLLPQILKADEIYTQHWDQKIKQGWTEPTALELDLGPQPESARITLFLTGWVYPTDPSVSISIQQDPMRAGFGILPPSLEVPDGQGGWTTASPYIGFPGGKTKTIAVDLTDQLRPGDGRLRIVTSMELHWDHIFFTVDEAPAEVRETPLKLLSADLHFRGCSARITHPQYGPERYDYTRVGPQLYPAMDGAFTRYGLVTELLTARDDQLVILGCGDECTLEFEAGPPLPAGWTRDFLLHNIGWDKDCNPQNIYARTVEPLPHAAMGSYPPEVPFPDDEPHREYLRKYQTRTQSDVPFRRFTVRTAREAE